MKRLVCGLDADARYDMVVGDYQEAGGKKKKSSLRGSTFWKPYIAKKKSSVRGEEAIHISWPRSST